MLWALNLGRDACRRVRQSLVPLQLYKYYNMAVAPYCLQCAFPFKEMGACPHPDASILYAYLSLLPYLIPALYLLTAPFTRRVSHFKLFLLLSSAYLVADKLLKKTLQDPRPPLSCKSSFGMPSSHMVVMVAYSFYQIRYTKAHPLEKAVWLLLSIAQGLARIELVYHTLAQVVAGAVFGVGFTVLFEACWRKCEPFFSWVPITSAQLAQKTGQKGQ